MAVRKTKAGLTSLKSTIGLKKNGLTKKVILEKMVLVKIMLEHKKM